MTGFDVSPAALESYAKLLARGADGGVASLYLNEAETYRGRYVTLDSDAGGLVFDSIVEQTRKVSDSIRAGNVRVEEVLGRSAYNLSVSADTYRTTDRTVAERLDEKYQPYGVSKLDVDLDPDAGGGSPTSKLTAPSGGDDGVDLVQEILGAADYTSAGGLAVKIMGFFGLHPEEWVRDRFLGDAGAIHRVESAIRNIAAFDTACGRELASGLDHMTAHWHGTAAAAATDYFTDFANALDGRRDVLIKVADRYRDFLTFLDWAADQIGSVLSTAIDVAVELAVEIAAAGCLASVPGVNAVVAIVGASTAFRLTRAVRDVIETWGRVKDLLDKNMAAFGLLSAELGSWDSTVRLPAGSYYNGSQTDGPAAPRTVPRNVR